MASSSGTKDDSDVTMEFKHFDILSGDVKNRNYFSDTMENNNIKGSLKKNIKKQWKMLQNNLPDSIYVRVYETRIDLLRAVIIGAQGTPYHDGLFFLDIYLKKPPLIFIHNYSHLEHENYQIKELIKSMFTDSTKCWKWNSFKILQVLVSIQDNILNAEPLFNQAQYKDVDRSLFTETSNIYNQKTFMSSCQIMLSIVQNPPADFEPLIAQHFRSRGPIILQDIQTCMNDHSASSNKFKRDAEQMYNQLQGAFNTMEEVIAPRQNVESSQINEENIPKRKDGTLKKIISPFKCFKG